MRIEDIARIAHQLNKVYCESIGDNTQVQWNDAPDWVKTSAINGVKFHLMNADATPEMSHLNWMTQKLIEGWKYGPEKDVEKKEHPCLVPYSQLLQSQKVKDYIFKEIVTQLREFLDEY